MTQLTWSNNNRHGRADFCQTTKAQPGSQFFLPDQLRAVEVENLVYDEDFNQLTVTAEAGQLAVAYCEIVGKPKFHYGHSYDYDFIYIFAVQEGICYPTLPMQPGKVVRMTVTPGQRFILPDGVKEILVAGNKAEKINQKFGGQSLAPFIYIDEKEGKPALAISVDSHGSTVNMGNEPLACIITTDEDATAFMFEFASPQIAQTTNAEPGQARTDLNVAPNSLQLLTADEGSVFWIPDHLEIRHSTNATYDSKKRLLTVQRQEGQKTRAFVCWQGFSNSDISMIEFDVLKTPEHPYLADIGDKNKLVIKTKQGAKFTLRGDEVPERERKGFSIETCSNARQIYENGRALIEIGVDDDGNPVKAKKGKGKAVVLVDVQTYDELADAEYPPVIVTYEFQY